MSRNGGDRFQPIRCFLAWVPASGKSASPPPPLAKGWHEWRAGELVVRYAPRDSSGAPRAVEKACLVLGDGNELDGRHSVENIAAGVPIVCDPSRRTVTLFTSIVGLPPIYRYVGPDFIVICSDIFLLREVLGITLCLSRESVAELGTIGHPLAQRTLFEEVELVASGGRLTMHDGGSWSFDSTWSLPPRTPMTWPEFLEAQTESFSAAVRRMDLSASVLSLTAGLDTRCVFAMLAAEGRLTPTVTMSGERLSLDARAALRLAKAYGVEHKLVTYDDSFARRLPALTEAASRLSGGLSTLDQAPEVFLYEELRGVYDARLSGNLGNQVGRGGTEGVSTRGANIEILAEGLRRGGQDIGSSGHWLLSNLVENEAATLTYILTQEIPFTLVSNFPIGSHFVTQKTPYADRALIETLSLRPTSRVGAPSGSKLRMRARDLRHRFLGEPEAHSFQRTLVKRIGGFAASYPINWGWRANGGISPIGATLGVGTLIGMYARAKGLDGGPLGTLGLPSLHDFRDSRRWLRFDLREFARDTLESSASRSLFDPSVLGPVLEEHFSGKTNHYETVVFALDVALAERHFCSAS